MSVFHRRALIAAGVVTACAVATAAALDVAAAPHRHFWRSAAQVVRIADRQPAVASLRARYPGVSGRASAPSLGLWKVSYAAAGARPVLVQIEDRTGHVLPVSNWSWPAVGTKLDSYKIKVELILAALGALFLALFFDWRRPLRMANLDVIALLSFGLSFALFDRAQPLLSVPLAYPPLLYLAARLLYVAIHGGGAKRELVAWASERTLLIGLGLVVAARIAVNLTLGHTDDVAYASVFGANSIHHGWPLYMAGSNHLDTYGPINYIAYLPFEALFPMNASWAHDSLPAAHAATITFDALTMLGLYLLGLRFSPGAAGRRLGLLLALGWATFPFTFFPFLLNTNDGLVAMFIVYAMLALSWPAARGIALGLGAAVKLAPLALIGLIAAGHGDRRPARLAEFALAFAAVIAIPLWLLLPSHDLQLFWDKTFAFQLQRHSFLSLWGQQPELSWLQDAVKIATVGLAALAFIVPRRRSAVQVAALGGAILIGLQLSMSYWSYVYLAWFAPLAIVCLCAAPVEERVTRRAVAVADREPAVARVGAVAAHTR